MLLDSINALKKEIVDTQTHVDDEEANSKAAAAAGKSLEKLNGIQAARDMMSLREKRAVLRELIDRIVITYDRADIYYSESVRLSSAEAQESLRISGGGAQTNTSS